MHRVFQEWPQGSNAEHTHVTVGLAVHKLPRKAFAPRHTRTLVYVARPLTRQGTVRATGLASRLIRHIQAGAQSLWLREHCYGPGEPSAHNGTACSAHNRVRCGG